jgi:hypothetical protein
MRLFASGNATAPWSPDTCCDVRGPRTGHARRESFRAKHSTMPGPRTDICIFAITGCNIRIFLGGNGKIPERSFGVFLRFHMKVKGREKNFKRSSRIGYLCRNSFMSRRWMYRMRGGLDRSCGVASLPCDAAVHERQRRQTMADVYIDYYEVSEYGRHFVREVARLEGTGGALVDIGQLKARMLAAVETVEQRLSESSAQSSALRTGRDGTSGATEAMRDALKRYLYFLRSLPAGTPMDLQAFYPGGNLGELPRLKPADVLARADVTLRGFDSPANAALPQAATWKSMLSAARAALAQALDAKGSAWSDDRTVTGDLMAARKEFLHLYHRVAKRLVRALLFDLGREHEYRRFFLDLQLSESARSQSTTPGTTPGTDAAPPATTPGVPTAPVASTTTPAA